MLLPLLLLLLFEEGVDESRRVLEVDFAPVFDGDLTPDFPGDEDDFEVLLAEDEDFERAGLGEDFLDFEPALEPGAADDLPFRCGAYGLTADGEDPSSWSSAFVSSLPAPPPPSIPTPAAPAGFGFDSHLSRSADPDVGGIGAASEFPGAALSVPVAAFAVAPLLVAFDAS